MKLAEIICQKIARFFYEAMIGRIMILQGMDLYPRCLRCSIRPDTLSRAAMVASLSSSIPITTMSPSRLPAGRSKNGRENRTDSSSWAIITARELSIRSMVALKGFLPPLFLVNDSPAPVFKCCHITAIVPDRGISSHEKGGVIHFPASGIDGYGGLGHQDKCRERIWA